MLELRHKDTGAIIAAIDAPTLSKEDMTNRNLAGVNLRDRTLWGTDFSGTDLTEADFSASMLAYFRFCGARLHKARFRRAEIHQCNLTDADLTEANLTDSHLFASDLTGADVRGMWLSFARVDIIDFGGKNLTGTRWRGTRVSRSRFREADLSEASIQGTTFQDCDLSGAHVERATVTDSIFRSVNFEGTDLTDCTLRAVCFVNCENLHLAAGLGTVRHSPPKRHFGGPSSLDVATIRASIHSLPDTFLIGFGYSDEEISGWRQLYPHPTAPVTDPSPPGQGQDTFSS